MQYIILELENCLPRCPLYRCCPSSRPHCDFPQCSPPCPCPPPRSQYCPPHTHGWLLNIWSRRHS